MRTISKRAGWRFGAGLLILSALVGLVVWQGLEPDGESSAAMSEEEGPRRPSPHAIQRTDSRQLAMFMQLRTHAEGLPADMRRTLRHPPFGANLDLAQRLPVHAQGGFWAVPAKGKICIVARGKGGIVNMICTTTNAALRRGVAIVTLGQPRGFSGRAARLTVGMAPDGTHTVVVHTAGSTTSAPVADGVFVVHDLATDPPDKLTFR